MTPENKTRPTHVVDLSWTFPVPRSTVFRAWTRAEAMAAWFKPTEGHQTEVLEFSAKPGGTYRVQVSGPAGDRYRVAGTYTEVEAPQKLVFTWNWEEGGPAEDVGQTVVTVEFEETSAGTRVHVSHRAFRDRAVRDVHAQGWNGSLRILRTILATKEHAALTGTTSHATQTTPAETARTSGEGS